MERQVKNNIVERERVNVRKRRESVDLDLRLLFGSS